MLDSYAVVAVDWKNSNRLRLKTRGIYRFHPQRLYRVHRPAAVIVILLLASGTLKVTLALYSTRVLYVKNLLRETNMALCVMAVVSGHTLVVVVWKRLNTCC